MAHAFATSATDRKLCWALSDVRKRLGLGSTVPATAPPVDAAAVLALIDNLRAASPAGQRDRLLIVIDQLEELLQAPRGARRHFAELLAAALTGPVSVVATLRSKDLEAVQTSQELAVLPRLDLSPLSELHGEALRTVIVEPARIAGITVDPDLVSALVADTGAMANVFISHAGKDAELAEMVRSDYRSVSVTLRGGVSAVSCDALRDP